MFIMIVKKFGDKEIAIRPVMARDLKASEKFQDFINSLVEEDAMILICTKRTKKEELTWVKEILEDMKKGQKVGLIAEYNSQIIGKTSITLGKERESHVGRFGLAIKNGYRGMGLGKFLMAEIIKLAQKRWGKKIKMIRLSVHQGNKPAFNLYKKMGFKQVAVIPNQVQYKGKLIDELIMLKYL